MEKFLIDSSIFLEILLNQAKKDACKKYLAERIGNLFISDFSLHSIGIILFNLNKTEDFNFFIDDVLILSLLRRHYCHFDGALRAREIPQ